MKRLSYEIKLFIEKHNYWAYTAYHNNILCLITFSREEYNTLFPMYGDKVKVLLQTDI